MKYRSGFQPTPQITVSEYSDQYRILTPPSRYPGLWRTDRTPYLREIMDVLSVYSGIQEICTKKPTQFGLTEVASNFVAYVIQIAPGPGKFIGITDGKVRAHIKKRIQPMIDASTELRRLVVSERQKYGGSTAQQKIFPGGTWDFDGAHSGTAFRQDTIRYMILDDINGFPLDVDGEGSPIELAQRRTDTYGLMKKIYYNSTPTDEGFSLIDDIFDESDQRYYHIPCPFCEKKQPWEWGGKLDDHGMKWDFDDNGKPTNIRYVCKYCKKGFEERYKGNIYEPGIVHAGEWVPENPGHYRAGFALNSLIGPVEFVPWAQVVKEFLESYKFPLKLKVWKNTRLGIADKLIGDQPKWEALRDRPRTNDFFEIPEKAKTILAGADVHKNRIDIVVRAFDFDGESWLIYHDRIHGPTNDINTWGQVDQILQREYEKKSGAKMRIRMMAIDSGYATQTVYNFCRLRPVNTIATKGSKTMNKPIFIGITNQDIDLASGLKIPGGAQLAGVGTDTAKAEIYARLKQTEGPGTYHFARQAEDSYFQEISAEKVVTKWVNGYPIPVWHNLGIDGANHALDCEVYILAAYHMCGFHRIHIPENKGKK